MPGAVWIGPSPNITRGAMRQVYGLVLHIQAGTEAGTEAWERNPDADVSSHFLAPRAGGVRQMVDTADMAWCQAAGNPHWLSVECEGVLGDVLTPAQVEACAQILLWAHEAYGVPLRPADTPTPATVNLGGLAYHSLGGAAWSPRRHSCPGPRIVAQRPTIILRAVALARSSGGVPVSDPATAAAEALLSYPLARGTVRDYLGRLEANYGRYDSRFDALQGTLDTILAQLRQAGPVAVPTADDIAAALIRQLGGRSG